MKLKNEVLFPQIIQIMVYFEFSDIYSKFYSLKHSVFWAVRAFVNFKLVLYISKAHKIFELSGIRARAVSVSGFIKLRQWYVWWQEDYKFLTVYMSFIQRIISGSIESILKSTKIQTYKFHNEFNYIFIGQCSDW